MPRFQPDRFPPGFFDLPPGAGEQLPLAVIAEWTGSAQTVAEARRILAPWTRDGYAVVSDAAGLTRLTRERPLVEILALLHRPKELLHAYGRAIGGQPIGIWAADNTEMFYPATVGAAPLLAMLRTVQAALATPGAIGTGIGVHRGLFWELSGGLYGADADLIETIAEEHTAGGELVVTGAAAADLPPGAGFVLEQRDDLSSIGAVFRVTDGPLATGLAAEDVRYPAPFDDAFTESLHRFGLAPRRSQATLPAPRAEERTVVLIERERDERDVPEMAVLNDLALAAAARRIAQALLAEHAGEEIKLAGRLGVWTFGEARHAAAFAQEFRRAFADQGVATRAGIDMGEVLVFDLGQGRRDIAGSPVNVASKLAQDLGQWGGILLSEAATRAARLERASRTVSLEASGVALTARSL